MEVSVFIYNPTYEDGIRNWLVEFKKETVKAATYERLKISYKQLMNYAISKLKVLDVRSVDIQKYVNALIREGYSISSVKKQFNLISAYMKYAYSEGYIHTPVYLAVKLPKQPKRRASTDKVKTYSAMEQRYLLEELHTMKHKVYAMAILMFETGMRIGEVLGLTEDDIDWDRKSISINKTYVKLHTQRGASFVQNGAKSDTSNRVIPLNKKALSVLQELCDGSRGYIFGGDKPFTYETVRYHIKAACKNANVEYKGTHAFRHTFATNCYRRGCDVKLLSKLLGHADVSITYNIYIHLYGDDLEEMRSVLG